MGHDYRGFQDKISGDVGTASLAAGSMEKTGKSTKVRIRNSDLESLVPSGSAVEFIPMAAHRLKFGDIIFVRAGKEMVIRRFLAFAITKNGSMAQVVKMGPPTIEVYPDTALVGRINKVEAGGQVYDPLKKESLTQRFANGWSCFGTSSPFTRLMRNLKAFGQMMKKKK